MRTSPLLLAAVASALAATAATPALAHAILVQSRPAAGAAVPSGPVAFNLRYNSRIDATRSRVLLTRPGFTVAVPDLAAGATPDTLTATATLAPGAYTLRWQVLAVDGHITRGIVPFQVTGAP